MMNASGSARMNEATGRTPSVKRISSIQPVNGSPESTERHVPVVGYQKTPSMVWGWSTGS